ncbi:MAG: hypothetical protein D3923_05070 [Candidatus Electrothrix sp. AR3]|nr:hypothetical protein [Candidatus Electrothrix sp. AR3]
MSLLVKMCKFFILYLVQVGCLWAGLEISTYLQGDALKKALEGFLFLFYTFPLLTTLLVFKEAQHLGLPADFLERRSLIAYTEGQTAWQHTQLSFFLRKIGIFYLFFCTILCFLLLYPLGSALTISGGQIVLAGVLLFFFCTNFFRIYVRRQTIRSLRIQRNLHRLSHHIRNEHSKILKKFSSKHQTSPDACLEHIASTLDLAKEYLEIITKDRSIELVLRLAFPHPEEQGNVIYKTLAITPGLTQRAWTVEPIAANAGIPRCLLEDCAQGNILIYRNLKRAIQDNLFVEANNKKEFLQEISTLMVSPLHAWDGKKKSMVGIVYVTSGKKNAFRQEHTDGMRFIANALSDTVSFSIIAHHMLIVKGKKNAYLRQLLEKY